MQVVFMFHFVFFSKSRFLILSSVPLRKVSLPRGLPNPFIVHMFLYGALALLHFICLILFLNLSKLKSILLSYVLLGFFSYL